MPYSHEGMAICKKSTDISATFNMFSWLESWKDAVSVSSRSVEWEGCSGHDYIFQFWTLFSDKTDCLVFWLKISHQFVKQARWPITSYLLDALAHYFFVVILAYGFLVVKGLEAQLHLLNYTFLSLHLLQELLIRNNLHASSWSLNYTMKQVPSSIWIYGSSAALLASKQPTSLQAH